MRRPCALAVIFCGIGSVSVAHAGTIKEVVIGGKGGFAGTVQIADDGTGGTRIQVRIPGRAAGT